MKKILLILIAVNFLFLNNNIFASTIKCSSETIQHPTGYVTKAVRNNICAYGQIISKFESNDINDYKNYCTINNKKHYFTEDTPPKKCEKGSVNTAKGYFQMINGTFKETIKKMPKEFIKYNTFINDEGVEVTVLKPIYSYTYSDQLRISWMDWHSKRPHSINVVTQLKDPDEALILYCEVHHTNCGQISKDRLLKLINDIEEWTEKSISKELKKKYLDAVILDRGENIEEISSADLKAICTDPTRANKGLVGFDSACADYSKQSGFTEMIGLIQRALNWIIGIAFLLAVLVLFYSGFVLLTANGEPAKRTQAISILKNVVIGLVLISAAWLLIDWIFELFNVLPEYKLISK